MNITQKLLAAALLTVPVAALASSAHTRPPEHRGTNADQMTSERAKALHECSLKADKTYPTWAYGSENTLSFRECMAEHSQPE